MQVKKQQLKLYMEQKNGSKSGKEYLTAAYCHPAYLNEEYIMRNAGLDETQAGIKIVGRNINNLRYADDTTLMLESKEELKSLLMKVKEEESEKVGWKRNIQKTKIMATSSITPWQIDGETVETVTDLFWEAWKSLQMVTVAMKLKNTCFLEEKLWPNSTAF